MKDRIDEFLNTDFARHATLEVLYMKRTGMTCKYCVILKKMSTRWWDICTTRWWDICTYMFRFYSIITYIQRILEINGVVRSHFLVGCSMRLYNRNILMLCVNLILYMLHNEDIYIQIPLVLLYIYIYIYGDWFAERRVRHVFLSRDT